MVKKRFVVKKFRCILLLLIIFIFTSGLRIVDYSDFYASEEVFIEYTVRERDTLWSISDLYKPEAMDKREYIMKISDLNDLKGINDIYPGEVLLLPVL